MTRLGTSALGHKGARKQLFLSALNKGNDIVLMIATQGKTKSGPTYSVSFMACESQYYYLRDNSYSSASLKRGCQKDM